MNTTCAMPADSLISVTQDTPELHINASMYLTLLFDDQASPMRSVPQRATECGDEHGVVKRASSVSRTATYGRGERRD